MSKSADGACKSLPPSIHDVKCSLELRGLHPVLVWDLLINRPCCTRVVRRQCRLRLRTPMPTSLGNNADAAATVWNAMKVAFEVHQAGASKDSPCSLTLDIVRVDSSRIRDLIETQMWKLALHVERGHHAFEDGDTALSVFQGKCDTRSRNLLHFGRPQINISTRCGG
jgi:hypothetical protein